MKGRHLMFKDFSSVKRMEKTQLKERKKDNEGKKDRTMMKESKKDNEERKRLKIKKQTQYK